MAKNFSGARLMASDGTISGTLASKRGNATILSGYLAGDHFTFVININIGQNFADVTFSGTYDGTALKGNISVEGYSIDFTGSKPSGGSSLAQVADFIQGDAR